jgi:hypothetical protein
MNFVLTCPAKFGPWGYRNTCECYLCQKEAPDAQHHKFNITNFAFPQRQSRVVSLTNLAVRTLFQGSQFERAYKLSPVVQQVWQEVFSTLKPEPFLYKQVGYTQAKQKRIVVPGLFGQRR